MHNLGAAILLCFGFVLAIAAASLSHRIVNGENAEIHDFPYQVSLRKNDRHFCGGSIIGSRYILTAAHCVDREVIAPYYDIRVNTGSSKSNGWSGRAYKIKAVVYHEEWFRSPENSYLNDIALITLTEDIAFNDNTKQIRLASKIAKFYDKAVITGWGANRYGSNDPLPHLQQAKMNIVTRDKCQIKLPRAKLYPGHVCAFQRYGVGACSGDSGGPLVVDNEVVGIASWVVPCAKGYPDVYTDVYNYLDWLHKKMRA